jgi:hypothetical protein
VAGALVAGALLLLELELELQAAIPVTRQAANTIAAIANRFSSTAAFPSSAPSHRPPLYG